MARSRGVRGAASWCAIAAIFYLLVRSLLYAGVSALLGLLQPGASLSKPVGFSDVTIGLLQLFIGIGAIAIPLWCMLYLTRLTSRDLRITLPAPWSPAFCLPVFLGIANAANLAGALLTNLLGIEVSTSILPSGGLELAVQFLVLCVMPAIAEELFFRGALQGLLRPCGSAAAIFGPALLFALLHLDPIQGLTALVCGIFLGWNCLAFLSLYLRFYAPSSVSFGVELFVLLFFPLFSLWLIYHARQQGFRFGAGLRPGVDVLEVFSSPAYTLTIIFLLLYTVFLSH